MTEELLAAKVVQEILKSGLVEIEVSARHVHLCTADVEALFGKGHTLTYQRDLSQPGEFLCEERVSVTGPKGTLANVAVLGPERKATQVELSVSDAFAVGIKPVLRESGDLTGSSPAEIQSAVGSISIAQGVIVAKRHIHVPPAVAEALGLHNKMCVSVETLTDRPVVFDDVVIRVGGTFRYKMHIDFDEANAAMVSGFTFGKMIR